MTYQWERPEQFKRELRKLGLTKDEAARIAKVMARFAAGSAMPKDHKPLRDGVEELRITGERRVVRLYFSRIEDRLVLLCLHVHIKKKKNDRDAVDLAVDRLKRYRDGSWGCSQ